MAQGDVHVLRRVYELWNDGDFAGWKDMHAPDVVVVPPDGWPEGGISHSRDEWFEQAMTLTDSWEMQRLEVDELRDLGDRVLSVLRWVTRGKDSGIDLETPMTCLTTVSGGKITRHEFSLDEQPAVEASD